MSITKPESYTTELSYTRQWSWVVGSCILWCTFWSSLSDSFYFSIQFDILFNKQVFEMIHIFLYKSFTNKAVFVHILFIANLHYILKKREIVCKISHPRYSIKKVFLKISQNSQESTSARFFFSNKVWGQGKGTGVFL